MPQFNMKFGSDGTLEPEDDDISNAYMLSRQVAHEYHSSATQSYIDAESAALQVQQQEAADEQAKFKQKQVEKQATAKSAESEFAETMVESLATRKPEATQSIGTRGAAPVAPEGGGGGWGDNAPDAMPSVSKEIQAEVGGIEAPMVDPTMAAAAGAGAAFKLSMSAGNALMPSLARAINSGVVNTITDPLYGTAAEVVGANNPALALPFNVLVGIGGGMAFEPMLERAITRASAKIGKAIDPAMMKAVLANEAGMVEVWHGSPHRFDKVSHEKIGTGEGAQAFGWGTYYTDKKKIAEHYSGQGTGQFEVFDIVGGGKSIKVDPGTPEDMAKSWLESATIKTHGGQDPYTLAETGIKGAIIIASDEKIPEYQKALDVLLKWKKSGVELKPSGAVYRAQLFPGKDPSEYTFLDWYGKPDDATLAKIQKAVESKLGKIDHDQISGIRRHIDRLEKERRTISDDVYDVAKRTPEEWKRINKIDQEVEDSYADIRRVRGSFVTESGDGYEIYKKLKNKTWS